MYFSTILTDNNHKTLIILLINIHIINVICAPNGHFGFRSVEKNPQTLRSGTHRIWIRHTLIS